MKKSLLSLVGVALTLMFGSFLVNAQEELPMNIDDAFPNGEAVSNSYVQLLNNYDQRWWYPEYNWFTWTIENNTLKLESPVILDSDLYEAPEYRMYFSPYRVEQLKWDNGISLPLMLMNVSRWDKGAESVAFEISTSNYSLDPLQIYYGFIVPLNDFDTVGTPSQEICFQFDRWLFAWGSDCDGMEAIVNPVVVDTPDPVVEDTNVEPVEEEHGAANCIWMDLANISHTVSNNVITLTWTAVQGDVVQIAVFDPTEEIYKPIWAVKMSDEKFSYQMTWNGEYNFKITNGCKDVFYKADAAKTKEPTIVPPATWPAENILYIAIAAIVLYGAYTLITRKSEN